MGRDFRNWEQVLRKRGEEECLSAMLGRQSRRQTFNLL